MSTESGAASPRRITVAIVCYDDHESLRKTLPTARVIGDEIVVVASGSSARCSDLAATPGLVVVERRGSTIIRPSAMRPWSVPAAIGCSGSNPAKTWRPPPRRAAAIRILSTADPGSVYLQIVTVPPVPGEISGEQSAQIRLMPRDSRLRYRGRVRERLGTVAGMARTGQRRTPLADCPRRVARTTPNSRSPAPGASWSWSKLDLAERGARPCLLVARGEALTGLHDAAGAAKAFRQAIAVSPAASSALREAYYGLLLTTHLDPAQRPCANPGLPRGAGEVSLRRPIALAMGGYMQAEGRLELSAQAYRTAVDFGQIDPHTWHVPDIHEIATICLSLTFQLRGDDVEARRCSTICSPNVPMPSASGGT